MEAEGSMIDEQGAEMKIKVLAVAAGQTRSIPMDGGGISSSFARSRPFSKESI